MPRSVQTVVPPDVLRDLSLGEGEPSAIFLRPDLRPVDRLAADLRALSPRAAARLVREHLFRRRVHAGGLRRESRALLPVYYAARVWSGVFSGFAPPEGAPSRPWWKSEFLGERSIIIAALC